MPPLFSILSGDEGFGIPVPDFEPATRRKAARIIWDNHVGGGTPLAYISEFTQLIKAGEEMTWYQHSSADPEIWGERWGEHGDDRDHPILVLWYLHVDIPDYYTWD